MDIQHIPCENCPTDEVGSLCQHCQGAKFALLVDNTEQLVWSKAIEPSLFATRRVQAIARKISVALIVLSIFACLIGLVWVLALPSTLFSLGLIVSGSTFGFLFCGVLIALLLLVFRAVTWSDTQKLIPPLAANTPATPYIREVSQYLDTSGWQILQLAYDLSSKQERAFLSPIHVFAAALTSSQGGTLLSRLGTTFEAWKAQLGQLLARIEYADHEKPVLSDNTREVLLRAYLFARENQRRTIGVLDLFQAAVEVDGSIRDALDVVGVPPERLSQVAHWLRLQEQLIEDHRAFQQLAQLKPDASMDRAMLAHATPLLDQYGEDLTRSARHDYLFPLIGRDKDMDQLLRGFESGHRAMTIIADAGIGKRALVEGLAQRMVIEDVPAVLFDKRMVVVDVAHVLAGGDPAYAPQRLLELIREAESSGNILLVLQQIDALLRASTNGIDLADILASDLSQGRLMLLATTTPDAWTEIIELNALSAQMSKLLLAEPEQAEVMELLMAKAGGIEYKTQVFFTYGALEQAYTSAKRYIKDVRLPKSALQLMTEAASSAQRKRSTGALVTEEDIAQIIHEKTRIPVESINSNEKEKLLGLEDRLKKRVIGQGEAVKAVSQAMRRARVDVREARRPMATFLFLGPTGIGKTELAKALASEYIGDEAFLVRLDMSEYQLASSVSRLIGAPGDNKGGLLTEAIRKQPFSIVLLDELEKAHPDILSLFLQVLDDGRLTDGIGRTVDFTNTIIIATSNAGASYIQQAVREEKSLDIIKRELLERELQTVYRPEFLNRFDGVIVFRPLTLDEVEQITWLQINRLAKNLQTKGIGFTADDEAVQWLAREGFDPQFGVRPLKRLIQDKVETEIADVLLRGEVSRKDTLVLEEGGHLRVDKWQG
ncbi:MAG: ATP-dependent Clp protease ATP-binding subunit [Candidatus Magasanikbacteria bacterium]|nr:ATP-dependent Clp protease ATP-binding subunit [Candidatus Magasanikbacteria bacterium]